MAGEIARAHIGLSLHDAPHAKRALHLMHQIHSQKSPGELGWMACMESERQRLGRFHRAKISHRIVREDIALF